MDQKWSYTPDDDVRVHEEGAIRLICKAFQSHENGLPEWLKNSSDAYAREQNIPESRRVIVVSFCNGNRGKKPSISCVDFLGMTSNNIENDFRIWADPEAAMRGGNVSAVQGGHGNGGKCYMTQMFEDHAFIHTVKNNKGNRYGVIGGSIKFGYIPDRDKGRDFEVSDVQSEIREAMKSIGCQFQNLPKPVHEAVDQILGFTLITGVGPKGYRDTIPVKQLIQNFQNHPQMIQTLQLCKVFVIVNGEPYNKGEPLYLPRISPIPGAEEPRIYDIPEELTDVEQKISTTNTSSLPRGKLKLFTSEVSMKWSWKARHNVIYVGNSGYIGYRPVSEFDVQSPYRDRIYGECKLEALEPFKQNDRSRLADSPLTRALERFVSEKIESYAKEFEAKDRRKYTQEEKNAVSKMNEALDKWKNRFLRDLLSSMWGAGEGSGIPPKHPPLPVGKPSKIEVSLTHSLVGIGVSLRPTIKFYDEKGARVRPIPFRWISDDTNVALVDEDLMIINTFSCGPTCIYAETHDRKLCSNKVPLEVVRIKNIIIVPNKLEVPAGTRNKLEAICSLVDGRETSSVYLVWNEDNSAVARVSSSGLVFAISPGETKITTGDDKCTAIEPALIRVVPSTGKGKGDKHGRGYPLVLVTGYDEDPDTKDTITCSSEDPPIYQRPQDADRNIWWINSSAPLASLYLDSSKGYGYNSREWRMYHLERYVDAIVQIALINGPAEKQSLSINDWIMEWGRQSAEIQSAAASDLIVFLATGELPRE